MSSVGEEFPKEQARVRGLLTRYRDIGPPGTFGAHILEGVLQRADVAIAGGDIIAILQSYEELKECK